MFLLFEAVTSVSGGELPGCFKGRTGNYFRYESKSLTLVDSTGLILFNSCNQGYA